MKIYRIENAKKVGPYVTGDMMYVSMKSYCRPYQPEPNMEEEFEGKYYYHLNFGFKSLEQLENWFPFGQLRILFEKGYQVTVFETKPQIESKTQVAFERKDSEICGIILSLAELSEELEKEMEEA